MKKVMITTMLLAFTTIGFSKDIKTVVVTTTPQMHCENCENTIKGNLRFEKGVKDITTDIEAQKVILKPDRTKKDADILEKSLSRQYPDLGFDEALLEEKEKLNTELQRARTNNDQDQCRVIEHLIGVTESVVNVHPSKRVDKLISNEPTYVISG